MELDVCDAAVGPPPDLADTAQPGTVSTPTTVPTEVIPTEPEPFSAMVPPVSEPTVDVPPLPQLTSLAGPVAPEVEVTVSVVLEPEVELPALPELSLPLATQPLGVDVSIVVVPGRVDDDRVARSARLTPRHAARPGPRAQRGCRGAHARDTELGRPRPTTTTWQPSGLRLTRRARSLLRGSTACARRRLAAHEGRCRSSVSRAPHRPRVRERRRARAERTGRRGRGAHGFLPSRRPRVGPRIRVARELSRAARTAPRSITRAESCGP